MARSPRRRRSVIVSWCKQPGGGEQAHETGEVGRDGADLAQPGDAGRRAHRLEAGFVEGCPGGLADGTIGDVGEQVDAQVAARPMRCRDTPGPAASGQRR